VKPDSMNGTRVGVGVNMRSLDFGCVSGYGGLAGGDTLTVLGSTVARWDRGQPECGAHRSQSRTGGSDSIRELEHQLRGEAVVLDGVVPKRQKRGSSPRGITGSSRHEDMKTS